MPRTGLSLQPEHTPDPAPDRRKGGSAALLAVLLLLLAGFGFVGYEMLRRTRAMEAHLAEVAAESRDAAARSREASEQAARAEAAARAAAEGRQLAEAQTATARQETETARNDADTARQEATSARDAAARAEAEAARIRKQAEAEMNRLEDALSQVAETRRTALGVVMNLNSNYLKFEFDKAELRPEDRELLSRIAGILLTSQDYTVSVNGHTDDVGSADYNQKLSERRAQAVRDYLVKVGVPEGIVSVTGHGKSLPLVRGATDVARATNRRVELGIANTRIRYGRPAAP